MPIENGITVEIAGTDAFQIAADVLVLFANSEDLHGASLSNLNRLVGGALFASIEAQRFEANPGQELSLSGLGKVKAARLLVLGLGSKNAPLAPWPKNPAETLRLAAGQGARAAKKAGAKKVVLALPGPLDEEKAASDAQAVVEGFCLGAYEFLHYKTGPESSKSSLKRLVLAVPAPLSHSRGLRAAVDLAAEISLAVNWTRDLVNLGPADCTPRKLASAAAELASESGLALKILTEKEITREKMGMFLGVTRGSVEPPRLVTVSYRPRGKGAGRPPLVFVGKAVTFDSGGLSLKPTESMVTMNTDMAGAAAVLGAMKVVAKLKPDFPVHGVFGACENMPGGRAYKPSDVLVSYAKKTVEVTNTDAEGRLVLGDVLAWAASTLKPAAMVDVATLTGACMVGLGHTTAGLFGPDGPVVDGVLTAACNAGEEVWRLPLVESLKDQLKSERADMKNTGERYGGAITAAHFLHAFVKDTPWAHLDIAGPSHATKERGYLPKGATGFGVRTLVEFVRGWEGRARKSP